MRVTPVVNNLMRRCTYQTLVMTQRDAQARACVVHEVLLSRLKKLTCVLNAHLRVKKSS
jgi:hypothetical protein